MNIVLGRPVSTIQDKFLHALNHVDETGRGAAIKI